MDPGRADPNSGLSLRATDPPVRRPPPPGGRPPTWLGITIITSGVVALGCLAVDGRDRLVGLADLADAYWVGFTIYSLDHVALGFGLLLTGMALMVVRSASWRIALVAAAGLFAAQLAGLGMVGVRRWPSFVGSYQNVPDWGLVRELAAVMALVCGITAFACLVCVLRLRRPQRRALWVAVPLGLLLAVVLPFLVPWAGADMRDRIAVGLQYGIPLGVALVVTALMELRPALLVTATVAASGLLMALSAAFVPPENLISANGLVVASALANLLWRLPHRQSSRAELRGP